MWGANEGACEVEDKDVGKDKDWGEDKNMSDARYQSDKTGDHEVRNHEEGKDAGESEN